MMRIMIMLFLVALTANAAVSYKDPQRSARASGTGTNVPPQHESAFAVQIPRGSNGEFAVQVRINGVAAATVVDTGATSVVLTYETAKAIGLPLELLEYNVDVQTASGHTKAARLWLDVDLQGTISFEQFLAARARLQFCRICGCTDDDACKGGCWWVSPGLCSRCVPKKKPGRRRRAEPS